MAAYKAPDFNERTALARQAKEKALAKLRAKPVPSEAELAERKAIRFEREAADEEKRQQKRMLAEEEAAAAAQQAEARAATAAQVPIRSEADRKAERDARYAARKARK